MSILRALKRRYGRSARGGVYDADAARDLDLFAANTGELYGQKQSILANIKRRHAKGTYDHSLAPKLWMYWVDRAAKLYRKEIGGPPINKTTREHLARELANRYRSGEE